MSGYYPDGQEDIDSVKPESEEEGKARIAEIARLNDLYRKTGDFVLTSGILAQSDFQDIIEAVKNFDAFSAMNDPYGEHDFGTIYFGADASKGIEGKKIFWKIDYFDKNLNGYQDPLSRECKRVLTVMLASEY